MTHVSAPAAAVGVRPRGQAVPVALAAGPLAVAVAAVVVMAAAGGGLVSSHVLVDAVVGTVSAVLGAYLVARVPRNPMGWLFALSGSAFVATAAVTAWAVAAGAWGWPGLLAAAWLSEWVYLLALGPQLTLLLLLFPDGSPPTARWRVVGWAGALAFGSLAVTWMLVPEIQLSPGELVPNPLGGSPLAATLTGPLLLVGALCGVASFASLVVRLRRAGPDERRRIAPYVAAAGLAVVAMSASPLAGAAAPYVQTVVLPLLPIAATLCVLRYRLYDLEIAVRRSLVWLGLTVVVVGGYALLVSAVSNLLQRTAGLPESLLAAGVVAALFQPARVWLQRAVGRALYGQRDDPDRALADLGRALEPSAEPTAALATAAERIVVSLAVPWVALEVVRPDASDADPAYVTSAGVRPGWAADTTVTTLPLVHAGIPRGTLSVSRRSPGEPLSRRDEELLASLAAPIAATAAAVGLTDDLRRSRERLVVAREEERRRLRHDLHDELGPLLAAMAVQLDAATLRVRRTGADDAFLLGLRATTNDAISTVRRAVEDLRPPALDELGLVDALRAALTAFETPGGAAPRVLAPAALPRLPAAVEVAAYRIVVEAVTNAVRHADARTIRCELDVVGDELRVSVTDDGRGISSGAPAGVGLTSMRERAEELGGTCTVARLDGGGTSVRAALPVGVQ